MSEVYLRNVPAADEVILYDPDTPDAPPEEGETPLRMLMGLGM